MRRCFQINQHGSREVVSVGGKQTVWLVDDFDADVSM